MATFIIQVRERNARTRKAEWRSLYPMSPQMVHFDTYSSAERVRRLLYPGNPPFVRVVPV